MSEVKRWTLWMVSESGCELEPYSEESPDGTYIKASDYDQLKAENERLRNSLSEVTTRIARDQRTQKATDSTLDGYLAAGISAADAERDTLRIQLAELQKRTCNKADAQSVVNACTELWIAEEEITKELRTQLAEARELFEYIKSDCTLSMLHRIDAWLEATKP